MRYLLQCGMRLHIAALLGRFLPRLGPFNHFEWPFFCALEAVGALRQ